MKAGRDRVTSIICARVDLKKQQEDLGPNIRYKIYIDIYLDVPDNIYSNIYEKNISYIYYIYILLNTIRKTTLYYIF